MCEKDISSIKNARIALPNTNLRTRKEHMVNLFSSLYRELRKGFAKVSLSLVSPQSHKAWSL